MGQINKCSPVKLIIGLIFKQESDYIRVKARLEKKFGAIDSESGPIPFIHTDYYEEEFGKDLKRTFLSFAKLIPPERLAMIKQATNAIEKKLSRKNQRTVNIDPGYLELAKLVLATTKNFAHRIYLQKGIYAEVTLVYQGNSFAPREWTYPDYRAQEYILIFNHIRRLYTRQIKP